eukprot:6199711-Pleurochrysis_carterae.AAC.1
MEREDYICRRRVLHARKAFSTSASGKVASGQSGAASSLASLRSRRGGHTRTRGMAPSQAQFTSVGVNKDTHTHTIYWQGYRKKIFERLRDRQQQQLTGI